MPGTVPVRFKACWKKPTYLTKHKVHLNYTDRFYYCFPINIPPRRCNVQIITLIITRYKYGLRDKHNFHVVVHLADKIEKNEMGGACISYEGEEMRVQGFGGET
jgi:hypothetical protein